MWAMPLSFCLLLIESHCSRKAQNHTLLIETELPVSVCENENETMNELVNVSTHLIWTSLCILFEVVTIDLHYMTDRQERFDLKMSKYCGIKDTFILDALEVS